MLSMGEMFIAGIGSVIVRLKGAKKRNTILKIEFLSKFFVTVICKSVELGLIGG